MGKGIYCCCESCTYMFIARAESLLCTRVPFVIFEFAYNNSIIDWCRTLILAKGYTLIESTPGY